MTFTPTSSKYAKEDCQGVFMVITNRAALQPVRVGLEIAGSAVEAARRSRTGWRTPIGSFGSRQVLERVKAGEDPARVAAAWSAAEARWRLLRAKYLLYR